MELRSGNLAIFQSQLLPNELICKILEELDIKDLLTCRFVSKNFKSIATAICRRRQVKLDLHWNVYETDNFNNLFKNFRKCPLTDLPFSACILVSKKDKRDRSGKCFDSLTKVQIQRFLGTFGPHITNLHLGGDHHGVIFKILKNMPNLTVLKSRVYNAFESDDPLQLVKTIDESEEAPPTLPHLKHLQVEIKWFVQVDFLEFLLLKVVQSQQLESVGIEMKARLGSADYSERVASLVAPIPSVALDLIFIGPRQLEPFTTFMSHKVRVSELALTVPEPERGRAEFFLPLQLFLASNTDTLEKLAVEDREWDPENPNSARLTIPPLRALKFLKFHCDEGLLHSPLVLLNPFTSNQFPSLVKVKVVYVNGFFSVFNSAVFPTVTHLVIKDYNEENTNPMRTDWDRIFPNVTKLEVRGVSSGALEEICRRMPGLVHLSLRVNTVRTYDPVTMLWESKGNAYSILSGYPPLVLPGDDEVLPRRSDVTLLALTALRTLKLDFRDCGEFPDSEIHLSLLQIQPLDYLGIRNTNMCEEYKWDLESHHRRFEVHEF